MKCQKPLMVIVVLMVLISISPSRGEASTVREVSFDEMLQQSQFVFDGTATSLEAKEDTHKRIHTLVTFEINEVLKGEYTGVTITLCFSGGTIGEVTMAVSDMHLPEVGEHGIYFVESIKRLQVHPLYGWSQGHFLMEPDATGTDRVMTNKKQPVTKLDTDKSSTQLIDPEQGAIQPLSKGVARGVTHSQEKNNNNGLTVDQFKKVIYEKIRMNN